MNQDRTRTGTEGISPDALMAHFRGSGLKTIIIFTVTVHAVVLLGFSLPFLWKKTFGEDPSKLSDDQRMDKAVAAATASLQKIAAANDVSPRDISSRLAPGGSRAPRAAAPAASPPAPAEQPAEPARPKSAYETNLEVKTEGPAMPSVETEKDIF